MSTDDINNNIAKAYAEMYNKPEAQEIVEVDINEDNTNDVSDDGDGMDKVQPKALKKKFKDRKDKDLDNDGDEDESDEYLHNRRKTVKKAVDKKDGDSVLEYSKEKHTKKEGIIDRMLAGRNKEGSKKWVTKKPETKEAVEPGFLMKRIQEKATANNVSKDDTRDSFDKQLAGRRIDDVAPASSGMTEAEFVKMHSPENANTPEFADAPVVHTKTLQAVKDSVKSKSPIRHNDSTIGESVELDEAPKMKYALVGKDMKIYSMSSDERDLRLNRRSLEQRFKDAAPLKMARLKTAQSIGDKVDKSQLKEEDEKKPMIGQPFKESVELDEKENDMNEGMTPMQRALAKVKAQSKDKVSVKKAPWDKDDAKKESVELDEATDFKSTFDDLKKGDTVKIKYTGLFASREKKGTFKVTAKSIVTKFKIGKITLVKQGEGDTKDKYYLYDRNGEVSFSEDDMGPKGISRDQNMTRLAKSKAKLVKESVELDDIENINEKNEFYGMKLKYNVADPSAKLDAKFREIQNELKELEKDMMTRKTRSARYLRWKNDKNPFDDCIDEISNVRNQLKPMMKSSEKAFDAAKKGDQKLSLISIVGVDAAKNMGRQSKKAARK